MRTAGLFPPPVATSFSATLGRASLACAPADRTDRLRAPARAEGVGVFGQDAGAADANRALNPSVIS